MSKEAERVYLTNKMKTGEGNYAFPIAYPNLPFDIPTNAPYAEFHIISSPQGVVVGGEGRGRVRMRYAGLVQLTVWVPKEKGTKTGTVSSDTFKDLFQFKVGRDTAGQTYKFGSIQDYTPETKAGWECFVYRVPFKRDSIEQVQIGI
jgi:hypothetical protein